MLEYNNNDDEIVKGKRESRESGSTTNRCPPESQLKVGKAPRRSLQEKDDS